MAERSEPGPAAARPGLPTSRPSGVANLVLTASVSTSVTPHTMGGVIWFTANVRPIRYTGRQSREKQAMSYVTQAELVEIVPDLRAMALVETSADVRAALNRLADRYAAMADGSQQADRVYEAAA
jgi:hypothetical protein